MTISGYEQPHRLAAQIGALEREREANEARGDAVRVKEIEAQIKVYGVALDDARKRASELAAEAAVA
jgi:hypothetical protein